MAPKRAIFEEVASTEAASAPTAGVIDAARRAGKPGAVRVWLQILFALVLVLIAVGGLTRLTDSGLSITEWAPVTGAVPPLSAEDWASEFEKYRAIPEYQLQNKGMSLAEFKVIYWWEWGHRQLARFIGVVWAVGFGALLATRSFPPGWIPRGLILGALGGTQAAVGWWMVSSGLEGTALDVASYRLAVHLGLAFVILGLIAWYILRLGREERELRQAKRDEERKLWGMSTGLLHMAFIQILLGALVAGIDAGRSYVDWPLMAGGFFPPEPFRLEPLWRNFFEEEGLVQFMHRMWGYLLAVFALVVWLKGRRSVHRQTRGAFSAMAIVLAFQIVLGIMTVLYVAPWQLAIFHQFTAVVLWVLILRARFYSRYPLVGSIKEGTA